MQTLLWDVPALPVLVELGLCCGRRRCELPSAGFTQRQKDTGEFSRDGGVGSSLLISFPVNSAQSSSPSDMTSSTSVASDPLLPSSPPPSLRDDRLCSRQLHNECLRGEMTLRTSDSSVTCPPSPLSPSDTCGLSPASSFPWPSSSSPSCHNRPGEPYVLTGDAGEPQKPLGLSTVCR